MGKDLWYFAYGSNLDRSQKVARTGTIREGRVCKLPNFSLIFNKRSTKHGSAANIVAQVGSAVWGVAFRCDGEAIAKMNAWEKGYRQLGVIVEELSGGQLDAITYVAEPSSLSTNSSPSPAYVASILSGAKQWGLPAEYINSIRVLAHTDVPNQLPGGST